MIWRKLLLAACAAMLPLVGVLALDTYLHHRADRNRSYAHVNRWGYRGPVLERKRSGEHRIAMVGGSTAFGLGAEVDESIPAVLERLLRQKSHRDMTVANLAFPADGAHADRWTLRHYRYLDYDTAIVYTGYNDLRDKNARNLGIHRNQSAIFRLTGYYPWLSAVLKGKASEWRRAGQQEAGEAPVVSPQILYSAGAAAFEFLGALDRQLRLSAESLQNVQVAGGAEGTFWDSYLGEIDGTIADMRADRKRLVLVLPPQYRASDDGIGLPGERLHASQQNALREFFKARYSGHPDVMLVDLSDALTLLDTRYAFHDRIHLTAAGNALIAERLAGPVLGFLSRSSR